MIQYNNGAPLYWRDERSGKMTEAVEAYFSPCADYQPFIPELSTAHVDLLRKYLVHWAQAPCWQNNPHINSDIRVQLDKAIAQAKSIECRSDISDCIDSLMMLSIDPF